MGSSCARGGPVLRALSRQVSRAYLPYRARGRVRGGSGRPEGVVSCPGFSLCDLSLGLAATWRTYLWMNWLGNAALTWIWKEGERSRAALASGSREWSPPPLFLSLLAARRLGTSTGSGRFWLEGASSPFWLAHCPVSRNPLERSVLRSRFEAGGGFESREGPRGRGPPRPRGRPRYAVRGGGGGLRGEGWGWPRQPSLVDRRYGSCRPLTAAAGNTQSGRFIYSFITFIARSIYIARGLPSVITGNLKRVATRMREGYLERWCSLYLGVAALFTPFAAIEKSGLLFRGCFCFPHFRKQFLFRLLARCICVSLSHSCFVLWISTHSPAYCRFVASHWTS